MLAELWPVLALTLKLASAATLVLWVLGTPLAWWLARTRSVFKPFVEATTALPLVLPPTVLGFYLLLLMSPQAPLGSFWLSLTGDTLTFSFTGLLVASVIYSLPFMVQPLQTAFESVGSELLDAAASLGASPASVFLSVACPLAVRGFVSASILTFAHTVGEFGVVLMIGGNIPGVTRVASIAIYDEVEAMRYDNAREYALALVGFSFLILLLVYVQNRRQHQRFGI